MNSEKVSKFKMRSFLVFNRYLQTVIFSLIILNFFGDNFSAKAQERVKSLNVRQFEIEEAIRNGLKYYL